VVAQQDGLRGALDDAVAGIPMRELSAAVERLSGQYRTGGEPTEPILRTRGDVAAYAAYRMPATHAAVRSALTELAALAPGLAPGTLLDIGGGTGAAAWAATTGRDLAAGRGSV
jgi:ribosomal protein RSM22 (predicted rRNA methylase)